jgi:hypothetical protein
MALEFLKNLYKEIIVKFDNVFGADRVSIYKFDQALFPNGCVVRHFCDTIGLRADYSKIVNKNEGLRLPMLKLLLAYKRYTPKTPPSLHTAQCYVKFLNHLRKENQKLGGPPLRMHSSLFEQGLSKWEEDGKWLEKRTGFSLHQDIYSLCGKRRAVFFGI